MNVGHTSGVELAEPQVISDNSRGTQYADCAENHDGCAHIVDDMNQAYPDLFLLCTDPADQESRQAVPDIDADDDGKDTAEADTHRTGYRLEDTDDRRRTLNDAGYGNACEESKKIVVFERYQKLA